MNFKKNDPMYYVQSDFDHLKYCYELLKANFSDNTRDTTKDDVLLFGVLITSWATYYRSLFDFLNSLNHRKDDIKIDSILPHNQIYSFKRINKALIEKYDSQLTDYKNQFSDSKSYLEDIKLKINKLISHLTQDRITTFENGYYVLEVENCSEYIIKAYESLIKVLKVVEDNQFENFDEVNTKKISSNEENSSPNIVSVNKRKDSFAAYTTSGIIINSPRSKLK